ncbi:MAG: carbohydrate porin [Gammaproteobacteria bacterium]|nr:carbohydrate porin [Gammaproteobacteria bacterium]
MKNKLSLLILSYSLLSFNVVADNAQFGGPEQVNNRIQEDSADRDLPLKEKLAAYGIDIAVDYSAVAFNVSDALAGADDSASGGMLRFYGSWKATENGSLIWKVEHRHSYTDTEPRFIGFNAGVSGLEVPPFSDQGTRLTNLYWKQSFNDKNTTLMAGFLDVTDYVDVYAVASPWTGFMNFAFSTGGAAMALPGDAALGIAGGTMIGNNFFIIGGIADMESDPTKPFSSLLDDSHFFKTVELGWTSGKDQIYVDNIHITFWDADESLEQGQAADSGVNFSASKMVGAWLPFLRVGVADNGSLLGIKKSVSTGFALYGLGGKSNTFGAALNWSDVAANDDQVTLEAFYLMKLMPFWELTPDIQIVQNPANNPNEDQVMILGLRTRLVW